MPRLWSILTRASAIERESLLVFLCKYSLPLQRSQVCQIRDPRNREKARESDWTKLSDGFLFTGKAVPCSDFEGRLYLEINGTPFPFLEINIMTWWQSLCTQYGIELNYSKELEMMENGNQSEAGVPLVPVSQARGEDIRRIIYFS